MLGVAVLASVFTGAGGYSSPQAFVNGLIPAMWVGVAVLAAGALVVLLFPFRTPSGAEVQSAAGRDAGAQLAPAGVPAGARVLGDGRTRVPVEAGEGAVALAGEAV